MPTREPVELLYDDPTQWSTSQVVATTVLSVVVSAAVVVLLLIVHRRFAGRGWYRLVTRTGLNGLMLTCLPLFLATAALWVRSHFVHERLAWEDHDTLWAMEQGRLMRFTAMSGNGRLSAEVEKARKPGERPRLIVSSRLLTVPPGRSWDWTTSWQAEPAESGAPWWERLGFGLVWAPQSHQNLYYAIAFPLWVPFVVFGALPTLRLVRRRHHRRGFCRRCGYDLRATPDRCPECGSGREAA